MTFTLRAREGERAGNRPTGLSRRRRYLWRGLLLVGALLVAYVGVKFVQVWLVSRRDGAR